MKDFYVVDMTTGGYSLVFSNNIEDVKDIYLKSLSDSDLKHLLNVCHIKGYDNVYDALIVSEV